MRRFGVCCVVLLGVACAEPAPSSSGTPACEAACDGSSSCELSSDPSCEFRPPGPWTVVQGFIESEAAPYGARGELYAFPSALGHVVTPISISEGSLDDQFWVSWSSEWSPDGAILVFDSCDGLDVLTLQCRLFTAEFGAGLPSGPHLVENLPQGAPLYAGAWDADSRAFPVSNQEEIYIVRREGNELVPSLVDTVVEVGDVYVCAGGEYAVHDDYEGVPMLLRADGDSAAHRELGMPGADYASAIVSPDGRWIVTSSETVQGEEYLYSISLRPCGEGEAMVLVEGATEELEGWFSPDSRYLALHEWWGAVIGYFDLRDESLAILPYPEKLSWIGDWSESSSFVLAGTEDGSVFAFRPDTREMLAVGSPGITAPEDGGQGFFLLGDLVERELRDPETGDLARVELYDPLVSSEPVVAFDLEPGTSPSVVVDATSTRVALLLDQATGAELKILDLAEPELESTLLIPGALSARLERFSHDGRAVALTASQTDVGLYWVSVPRPGEPLEFRAMAPALGAEFVGEQPWP